MASNSVEFRVVVNADGLVTGLKQVTNFGNETQKAGKKAREAGDAAEHLNYRMNQGVTGASSAARSFSKLNQTIGQGNSGLVGAYATLAANTFAVSAAFNALRSAQQAEMVLKGLEVQGARTGRTLTVAAESLRQVVGMGISSQEAMQATALFTSTGFSSNELERLGQVAQNTSLALGRNLPDSLDRLIKGTTKLEPELLDELGIMTKLGDATSAYALKTGKSVNSLSSFEKRQAFLNAVLAEGELKFGGLNEQIQANPYDKLAASFDNLNKQLTGFANNTLGFSNLATFLSESTAGLTGALLLFGSTIQKNLLGSLTDLSSKLSESAKASRLEAKELRDNVAEKLKQAKANISATLAAQRNVEVLKIAPKAVKELNDAFKAGTVNQKEFESALDSLNRSIRTHTALLEKEKQAQKDTSGREAKIAALTTEKARIDALMKAELSEAQKVIPLATDAKRLQVLERAKSIQARAQETAAVAIQAAGEKNLLVAVRSSIAAIKEYNLSLALLNKNNLSSAASTNIFSAAILRLAPSFRFVQVAAFAASTAIRTFTAAILGVIGGIGILLLVLGALQSAYEFIYKKLFPNTAKANEELTKASEAYTEVLNNQQKTLEEQKRIMASSASMGDRLIASWSSQSNAALELSDSLNKLVKAREDRARAEALDAAASSDNTIESANASAAKRFGVVDIAPALQVLPDVIFQATSGLEQFMSVADEDLQLVQTITLLSAQMGQAGLVASIEKATGSLANFQKLVKGDSTGALKVLAQIQEQNAKGAARMQEAIEKLNSAFSKGSAAGAKFFSDAVPSTPFDDIVSSFAEINSSLATFKQEGKSAGEIIAIITKIPAELQNFLNTEDLNLINSFKQAQSIVDTLTPQLKTATEGQRRILQSQIDQAQTLLGSAGQYADKLQRSLLLVEAENESRRAGIALAQSQASLEQARFSKFSQYLTKSGAAVRAQLESENKVIALNNRGAQIQKAILDTMLAQRREAIEKQRIDLKTLENKQKELLLAQKISLEEYNRIKNQNLAAKASIGVLQPGAVLPGIDTNIENATREMDILKDQILIGEKALIKAELQSKALGNQIAAAATKANSSAEINAAAAVADAELALDKVKERVALERDAFEVRKLGIELTAARAGQVTQGGTSNTGEPQLRAMPIIEIQLSAAKYEMDLSNLVDESATQLTLLATKIEQAELGVKLAVTPAEKAAAKETLKTAELALENEGQRFINANERLDLENQINITRLAGVSGVLEVLRLEESVVTAKREALEVQNQVNQAQFEYKQSLRDTVLSAVGVSDPFAGAKAARQELDQYEKLKQVRIDEINARFAIIEAERLAQIRNIEAAEKAATKAGDTAEASRLGGLRTKLETTLPNIETQRAESISLINVEGDAAKVKLLQERVAPYTNMLLENFKKLGPDGEAAAAVFSGLGQITNGAINAFEEIDKAGDNTKLKVAAIAGAMAQAMGAIISIVSAISNARIAAVDKEIAAEQKRDGKSAESVTKMQALEKKKDDIARKAFNTNKKLMMAQAVMGTAAGIAGALGTNPGIAGIILASIIGAMGAAQLAIIAGTQYQSTAKSSAVATPSTLSIGKRSDTVDLARGPSVNAGGEAGFIRGSQGMGTNASNFRTIGSAYGGELARGYGNRGFVVGEKGPEVITPETPINVTPANDVMGSAPVNATINIQALDASGVQDILLSQKGNIISMIRQAANASGQGFLEDVNVNVYTRPQVNKL